MRDLSHHHWGMTSRNARERNGGSRNDAALTALVSRLEDAHVSSAFVQTCGHRNSHYSPGREEVLLGACPLDLPDCRVATALFLGYGGDFPRDDANVMVRLGRKLRVPSFVVGHDRRDESLSEDVSIDRVRYGVPVHSTGSWRDFAVALRGAQHLHERRSEHPDCVSDDEEWLNAGEGIGLGTDLSVSNAIREVPGVRHTDIDAILSCLDCGNPVVLIESSSDGITPREDAVKAATVTRDIGRRAKVVTVLIQHQVNDSSLTHPISLTRWAVTGNISERYDHEMTDWTTAQRVLQTILDEHYERFCDG